MRRWFYPNKVHADRANLTKWYLSIWRSNLEIEHIVMTIRTSISFLWNEWINTCNATLNVRYMNGHSSHIPWLNYGVKSSVYTATTKKVTSLSLSLSLNLFFIFCLIFFYCVSSLGWWIFVLIRILLWVDAI